MFLWRISYACEFLKIFSHAEKSVRPSKVDYESTDRVDCANFYDVQKLT